MIELIIDNEFKELLPPLSDEKYKQLEKNLLRDGIREPLTVWNGILIDGHNRYNIARLHNLEFTTVEMAFDSRDAVKIWIADNQFGRRDLTVYERSLLAIKIKPSIAVLAKERQGERNDLNIVKNSCQSSEEPAPVSKSKSARENKTDYQVAQKAGVSEDTIRKVERIEQQATPEIKQALRAGDMSINAAYNKVQQAARKEDIQRQVDEIEQRAIEKPDGLFDVIVIDPPWNYGTQLLAEAYRAANPYPEMTQAQLKAIELPAADNCVLFLWTTHKFIWDAKELLDHWGFDYRCMLVWNKQQMGMGNLIRMQCEFCLVALKGKPAFKDVHNARDLIEEPRREHSRKPDAFYRLVEELCAGRKLDYFSRTKREGWVTYGNDTEKFPVA